MQYNCYYIALTILIDIYIYIYRVLDIQLYKHHKKQHINTNVIVTTIMIYAKVFILVLGASPGLTRRIVDGNFFQKNLDKYLSKFLKPSFSQNYQFLEELPN